MRQLYEWWSIESHYSAGVHREQPTNEQTTSVVLFVCYLPAMHAGPIWKASARLYQQTLQSLRTQTANNQQLIASVLTLCRQSLSWEWRVDITYYAISYWLTLCDIFSRTEIEIRYFAHCILIIDPSGGTPSNININIHRIAEKYL